MTRVGSKPETVTLAARDWIAIVGICCGLAGLVVSGWLQRDRDLERVSTNQQTIKEQLREIAETVSRLDREVSRINGKADR